MKNLIIALLLITGFCSTLDAQVGSQKSFNNSTEIFDFYDKYAGEDGFTTVYITSKMFELFASMEIEVEEEAKEVIDIAKDLRGIRILVYGVDFKFDDEEDDLEERFEDAKVTLGSKNPNFDSQKLFNEVYSMVPSNTYDDLMIVKSNGADVRFMIKESSPGVIDELLMLVGEESTFVFMSIVGKIDLKRISKLANSVDIDGLDHLEALDSKKH